MVEAPAKEHVLHTVGARIPKEGTYCRECDTLLCFISPADRRNPFFAYHCMKPKDHSGPHGRPGCRGEW